MIVFYWFYSVAVSYTHLDVYKRQGQADALSIPAGGDGASRAVPCDAGIAQRLKGGREGQEGAVTLQLGYRVREGKGLPVDQNIEVALAGGNGVGERLENVRFSGKSGGAYC